MTPKFPTTVPVHSTEASIVKAFKLTPKMMHALLTVPSTVKPGTLEDLVCRGLLAVDKGPYTRTAILTKLGQDVVDVIVSYRDDLARTNARVAEINAAPAKAEPFRPAYKTVTKVEVSYVLQSSIDGELWSYVSGHTTEQGATQRAQAFLIEGSRLKFRVAEHRSEIRATAIIETPSEKPEAAYRVDEDTWDGYAVYETATDRCVYRSMSRYGAQTVCDGLNSGEMVLRDGTVVQA